MISQMFFFCSFFQTANSDKLTAFINTLNGKDGNLCHLVTVPPGPLLSDALISSPILQGEDGAPAGMEYASEYGFDPNSDPELALVSDHRLHLYHYMGEHSLQKFKISWFLVGEWKVFDYNETSFERTHS